jgi:hypothetical protein
MQYPTERDAHSETTATEADHDAETPVNPVHFSDSGRQFILEECVLCGETHRHGSCDPVVAKGGRSHRVGHCHGINHSGGYYLELADDAEPPHWWTGWIARERGLDMAEVEL